MEAKKSKSTEELLGVDFRWVTTQFDDGVASGEQVYV